MSANLYATTNNRCVRFNLFKYFQNLHEYNLSLNKEWTFDTNLGYFIFYHFFKIISEIPYILVASGSLHQLFLCKSDEFLFSSAAGEKKHSDRGFLKELILPLSSLDSYLRSGTARKFFDAAHSGNWVVADRCTQQVAQLEGPKGKALTEDQYVHLLLNASFSDELSPHQFSGRNKDSRSLMEHGVGYYLFKALWTNKN